MPIGAEILSVQVQRGNPHMWALVDPEAPCEVRTFRILGTGYIELGAPGQHLGSFQLNDGALVFHVFEPYKEGGA